jgi:hypothetical protein
MCHEGVWGSGCIGSHFLALSTGSRWVVRFTPRPLYPRGKNPRTHWIGGMVDPRFGLEGVEKIKFVTLTELKFRPPPPRRQSLDRRCYPDYALHLNMLRSFCTLLLVAAILRFWKGLFSRPIDSRITLTISPPLINILHFSHRNEASGVHKWIWVRFLAGARDISLLHSVETGSGPHTVSCLMCRGWLLISI